MEQITLTPEQKRSAIFRFADNNKLSVRGPHDPVRLPRYSADRSQRYWHFTFGITPELQDSVNHEVDIHLYTGYIFRFMAGLYPERAVHMVMTPLDMDLRVSVFVPSAGVS